MCGDKDLSGLVDGGGVVLFGRVDGFEGGFAVIGDGDAAEEAGPVAGVAGTVAFLIDAEDEGVLVAIGEDFDDFLDVAAFFAFVPEPLAAAAEVDGFAEGEGEAERFLVHEGDHEDGAGDGVDGDGGDEAIGVEFRGEGGTGFDGGFGVAGAEDDGGGGILLVGSHGFISGVGMRSCKRRASRSWRRRRQEWLFGWEELWQGGGNMKIRRLITGVAMVVAWGAASTVAYGQTAGVQGEAGAKPKVKSEAEKAVEKAEMQKAMEKAAADQERVLKGAVAVGREWMKAVEAGDYGKGMKRWGYQAFERHAEGDVVATLKGQTAELGKLKSALLLEDRSLVDLNGPPEKPGSYVTLRWFSRYERRAQREYLVVHEPVKDGDGPRILGLRREELPMGKEGAVELAADIGHAVMLRLRELPEAQWKPYVLEAEAIATGMKLVLPPLPGDPGPEQRDKAGAAVVEYLMDGINPLLEKLDDAGGRREARMVLTSFALLIAYKPGEELVTRLGAIIGADGAKSGLPAGLWQPVVKAVVDKEPAARVYELVQTMVSDVALHLRTEERDRVLAGSARELLDKAFANMAGLKSYEVKAEFRAGEKTAWMEAAMTLEAAEVKLTGFDGAKQARLAGKQGFWVSGDEGKTWVEDGDRETAAGLLRTLTSPVDPGFKVTSQHEFTVEGEEVVDGERLVRVRSREATPEAPLDYWVLMSKSGPVIRRAVVVLSFGNVPALAELVYTKLGKPVVITQLEEVPAAGSVPGGGGR